MAFTVLAVVVVVVAVVRLIAPVFVSVIANAFALSKRYSAYDCHSKGHKYH